MSVVAEFTTPARTGRLGRLSTPESGVRTELERVVLTGSEIVPYFWAEGVVADGEPSSGSCAAIS